MFADLHLHTHFSDGTYTPDELAAAAHSRGLGAIALTDHDTVDGCAPTATACARLGMEFIPGTELTAGWGDHEIHILGYWVDDTDADFRRELERFQGYRRDRILQIVARLNSLGVPLTAEAVFALAACRSPGRPHIARALLQGGFVPDFDTAFERYLKKGCAAWVPKPRIEAPDAIQLIHRAGGVAVLAHPGLYRRDGMIADLAAAGLDGLECWHTKHHSAMAVNYVRIATELNLAPTGGSDCHGLNKGDPLVGTMKLPYDRVAALHARRPRRDPVA